jgi:hypothetical protein
MKKSDFEVLNALGRGSNCRDGSHVKGLWLIGTNFYFLEYTTAEKESGMFCFDLEQWDWSNSPSRRTALRFLAVVIWLLPISQVESSESLPRTSSSGSRVYLDALRKKHVSLHHLLICTTPLTTETINFGSVCPPLLSGGWSISKSATFPNLPTESRLALVGRFSFT